MNERMSHLSARLGVAAALFGAAACLLAGCGGEVSPPTRPPNMFDAMVLRTALEKGAEGDSQTEEPALAEPTGWATIRGKFVFRGAPPPPVALTVTKDQEVCAAPGHQPMEESLVVSPNGGIRDVLIFLTTPIPDDSASADAKYTHPSYNLESNPQLAQVEYDQKYCVFLSHVFAARVGQTILIKNSDPIGHNTSLAPRMATTFNTTIPVGGAATYVPDRPEREPFDVKCSIHDWMNAKMIFRDNPYFAVTDENGEFEIANVPAGVPLEFRVWQPRVTNVTKVTYTGPEGVSEQNWKKGVMKVTLAPDTPHSFEAAIDASLIK
jgi:plastocyanin